MDVYRGDYGAGEVSNQLSLLTEIDSLVPHQDVVAIRGLVQEQGRQFYIPFNQRPWVWKRKNQRELWTDLKRTAEKFFHWNATRGVFEEREHPTGNPHYFGAFVFYEREANTYEVVDGQQRLTSACMLAAVLRELAQEISDQSDKDLSLRHKANGLAESLTAWLLSDTATQSPRLKLDPQYADLFREYVVEPRSAQDRATAYEQLDQGIRSQRANTHIKEGFDFLRKLVFNDFNGLTYEQRLEHVRAYACALSEALIATRIVITSEPFALSVFSGLNARGVPLSAADQIKNELFERAGKGDHEQIKNDWDTIVATVPGGDIAHFLRQRHLAFVGTDCPKNKLYVRVRDEELEPANPKTVISRWRKDAELLSVLTGDKSHVKIKGELARHLKTLHEQLSISFSWPLLLSAGKRFFPADMDTFSKLTRLTLAFCFRVLTIGRADVLDLERWIAQAAFDLSSGASPKAIAKTLREANTNDDFERDFAKATLTRASSQFYVLYEFEVYRSKSAGLTLEPFPHSPRQNIEHILPRKLSTAGARIGEWSTWRSLSDPSEATEEHRKYVNRLGNLLILEAEINRDVSNYDFDAKLTGKFPGKAAMAKGGAARKSYLDSRLKLPVEVNSKYSKWTADEIDLRQRALASEAAKVWNLRFE